MAAVTAGWLAARLALARFLPFVLARAAVFSLAAAVALSAVVFPAYDDETVIESFPVAVAAPAPPATPVPVPVTRPRVAVIAPAPEPEPAATTAGPQRLRSGPFRGIDHRASGTAAIYRQPDGRSVVGLEGGPWTVLVWCQTFAVPVADATPS